MARGARCWYATQAARLGRPGGTEGDVQAVRSELGHALQVTLDTLYKWDTLYKSARCPGPAVSVSLCTCLPACLPVCLPRVFTWLCSRQTAPTGRLIRIHMRVYSPALDSAGFGRAGPG